MKKLMELAWNIAKEGAARHGGKAVEYISESMKLAHQIMAKRKTMSVSVEADVNVVGDKTYFVIKKDGVVAYQGHGRKSNYKMLFTQYAREYKIELINNFIDGTFAGFALPPQG